MDTQNNSIRTGPAEDLDFTEDDWLTEMIAADRAKGGEIEYIKPNERTVKDYMRATGMSRDRARTRLEAKVKAGELLTRIARQGGHHVRVYYPAPPCSE